jgi:hypothetical protein
MVTVDVEFRMFTMGKDRLKRNVKILQKLSKAKRYERNKQIQSAKGDTVKCVCDCARNVLNGNIPLSKSQYKYLQKYRCSLRRLGNKNLNAVERKNLIINQRGGFLPNLLIPVLSVAGSLLAEKILKK